jgi:DNA repair protein RadD
VFSKVVHAVQNGDLFAAGHLAKLEYKQVKTGFRTDRLRLNSTGADYTDQSVREHFAELHFSDQIVRCVHRLGELNRRGALVFTRFVEEAEYVSAKIPGAQIVTAETSNRDREQILAGFKKGQIPVVTNVGVLTVGFDYPELGNIILARPTMSLALYYQMVGRGMRPHPNKESTFIVDMVGLVEKFGRIEDLKLESGPHDTWYLSSQGRQLTNVYYQ